MLMHDSEVYNWLMTAAARS